MKKKKILEVASPYRTCNLFEDSSSNTIPIPQIVVGAVRFLVLSIEIVQGHAAKLTP